MERVEDESTICKQNISDITLIDNVINSLSKSCSEHNSFFEATKKATSNTKVQGETVFKQYNRNGLSSLIFTHSRDFTKTLNKLQETEQRFKEVLASSKDFLRNQISKSKHNEKENYANYKYTSEVNGAIKGIEYSIENIELGTNKKKLLKDENNSKVTPQEEYASNRTEGIFKEYIQITKEPKTFKTNYITYISTITSLRYINFQDLLHKLKTLADNNSNKVTKTDLTESITSMISVNEDVILNLYEALGEELLFEELIGALAVLCKGKMQDKVEVAFLYLGSNNNRITFSLLYKFLLSIYKIMMSQIKSSAKNSDISAEQLAHLTSIQCFDNHKYMTTHNSTITAEEFTLWFRSQARRLTPDCIQSISPKRIKEEMPSISIHINSASEELSCSIIKDKNIQKQWNDFFEQYYMVHGYYPHPPSITVQNLK